MRNLKAVLSLLAVVVTVSGIPAFSDPAQQEMFQRIGQSVSANKTSFSDEAQAMGADSMFQDLPPGGGVLVGFTVTFVPFAGQDLIKTIEPWYLTRTGLVVGSEHGSRKADSKVQRVMAKDGYAVGALTLHCGIFINGFQVTFKKIHTLNASDSLGDCLVRQDSYSEDWVGYKGGAGSDKTIDSKGALVVGIFGKVTKDATPDRHDVRSLGFVLLKS